MPTFREVYKGARWLVGHGFVSRLAYLPAMAQQLEDQSDRLGFLLETLREVRADLQSAHEDYEKAQAEAQAFRGYSKDECDRLRAERDAAYANYEKLAAELTRQRASGDAMAVAIAAALAVPTPAPPPPANAMTTLGWLSWAKNAYGAIEDITTHLTSAEPWRKNQCPIAR